MAAGKLHSWLRCSRPRRPSETTDLSLRTQPLATGRWRFRARITALYSRFPYPIAGSPSQPLSVRRRSVLWLVPKTVVSYQACAGGRAGCQDGTRRAVLAARGWLDPSPWSVPVPRRHVVRSYLVLVWGIPFNTCSRSIDGIIEEGEESMQGAEDPTVRDAGIREQDDREYHHQEQGAEHLHLAHHIRHLDPADHAGQQKAQAVRERDKSKSQGQSSPRQGRHGSGWPRTQRRSPQRSA